MQKALQLMNIQLTNVITDITGQTGQQIIRAIIAGEHDPVRLAQYRDGRCRSSEAEIAKALTGHYQSEHLFALQQAVELYDFYGQQIQACDVEIERKYTAFRPVVEMETQPLPPAPKRRRSKNEPDFNLRQSLYQLTGVDLTRIDGLETLSVQQIISETGTDMSHWPTVKHFTSWLTLAPHNDISGGKILNSRTLKSKNRAAQAFRMAAQSVSRSNSALGGFYRRIRAKHGGPKAITATAHKIARIFYHMLKYKQEYQDPGQDYYEQKYQERVVKNLKRKAQALGFDLVPQPTVS
jgi:transposase